MALGAAASAQDSTDADGQTPLGDVVRRQREQRQHSKTAKRVVSDDDVPGSHMQWVTNWVAVTRIIPGVKIQGLAPDDTSVATAMGQKKGKIYISFGPDNGGPIGDSLDSQWCNTDPLDCAEQAFIAQVQRGGSIGSKGRILFDSDDTVQTYPARVAHFEVVHDVRGKMQGSVALIESPVGILSARCLYSVQDQIEAEPQCDKFISSLRIDFPEKYVYVKQY